MADVVWYKITLKKKQLENGKQFDLFSQVARLKPLSQSPSDVVLYASVTQNLPDQDYFLTVTKDLVPHIGPLFETFSPLPCDEPHRNTIETVSTG